MYAELLKDTVDELKSIMAENIIGPFHSPQKWKHLLCLPVIFVIYVVVVLLFFMLFVTVVPIVLIIKKFSPRRINDKTDVIPEEDFVSSIPPIHYSVPTEDLQFDPSSCEVIYYNPSAESVFDEIINLHLEEIKEIFLSKGKRFIYLPDYNNSSGPESWNRLLDYSNPSAGDKKPDYQGLSYAEIASAYHIPAYIKEPCLIRCMSADSDRGFHLWNGKFDVTGISSDYSVLHFSIKFLEARDWDSFLSEIRTYLRNCYSGPLYCIEKPEQTESRLSGLSADDRFDEDMYIIGREIRDRIDILRGKGLSSYAIRKLIGVDMGKPGNLLIDKHNKLILTDFGNREIKLEPLQKAVFFLFLRHPEGIYFKDLRDYREELSNIYREITGREDLAGIEDSINKLTDPFNNSINEKCARIKNAFVSEFREEVAQWYFIDGKRGERKLIKIPRELVTWEIKD